MKAFPKELQRIKQKDFDLLYLFHGEESYYIDELTKALEENVLSESEKSFNLSVLYGKDVDAKTVMDHVGQYPMMATKRLVIVKEAQNMKDLAKLEPYINNPIDSTILVICHKHKKLDGRTGFAKAVKKKANFLESKKLYDNQVPTWILENIKSKGFEINHKAVMQLAESVGTDMSNIVSEINKLLINIQLGETIRPEHIEKYIGISKTYNVFELQKAIGSKNRIAAFKIINHFESNPKAHPLVMIIGFMFGYFSKLFILAQNRSLPEMQVAKMMGMNNAYFLKDYHTALNNYTGEQLRNSLLLLSEYDLKSKGVNSKNVPDLSLLRELTYRIME